MKLKPDQERVKTLISDTLTLLCKNGLNYNSEFCVDALIGITLDKDQVFLVNIRETITKDTKRNHNSVRVRKRKPSDERRCNVPNGNHTESEYAASKARRIEGRDERLSQLSLSSVVSKKQLFRSNDVKSPESHSSNTFHANSEVVDLSEMSSETEIHDLSVKDNHIVIKPLSEDESEHPMVAQSKQQHLSHVDGSENIPPADVIGSGPPVWPEPSLTFPPSLSSDVTSPSIAAISNQDSPGQPQDWAIIAGGTNQQSPGSSYIDAATGKCACPVCGKSFRENWMVRRHMSTHSAANVVCAYCDKRFKRKDTLKAHIDRNHPGMVYELPTPAPAPEKRRITPQGTPALLPPDRKLITDMQHPVANIAPSLAVTDLSGNLELIGQPRVSFAALRPQTIEEFEGTDGRPVDELDTALAIPKIIESSVVEHDISTVVDHDISTVVDHDISTDVDLQSAYSDTRELRSGGKDLDDSVEGIEFVNEVVGHVTL